MQKSCSNNRLDLAGVPYTVLDYPCILANEPFCMISPIRILVCAMLYFSDLYTILCGNR